MLLALFGVFGVFGVFGDFGAFDFASVRSARELLRETNGSGVGGKVFMRESRPAWKASGLLR